MTQNSNNGSGDSKKPHERGLEKLKVMRSMGWKPMLLGPIEKAIRNPKSRTLAIYAKCWDCVGRDSDPRPKLRIKFCKVGPVCALYNFRPYQKIKGELEDLDD